MFRLIRDSKTLFPLQALVLNPDVYLTNFRLVFDSSVNTSKPRYNADSLSSEVVLEELIPQVSSGSSTIVINEDG